MVEAVFMIKKVCRLSGIRYFLMLSLLLFLDGCWRDEHSESNKLNEDVESVSSEPVVKPNKGADEIRALYVGASDGMHLLDDIRRLKCNAVVIDVKDERGEITCDLDLPAKYKRRDNVFAVRKVIEKLKSFGLYTIARIVVFRDDYAVTKFPDLAVKNKDGTMLRDKEKSVWLNPYNREVWKYIFAVAEASASVGFDEIQFDYARFSPYKNPDVDFGPESEKFSRMEIMNMFFDWIVKKLRKLGVKISIDVFGCIIPDTLGEDSIVGAQRIGQDWHHIMEIFDFICPMIYPSHWSSMSGGIKYPDREPAQLVRVVMKKAMASRRQDKGAIIRPWLQAFTADWLPKKVYQKYTIAQINEQTQASEDAGINQWSFWNPSANYRAFR
jgi:hypothetical protein